MWRQTLDFYKQVVWRAIAAVVAPADSEPDPARWVWKSRLLRRAGLHLGRDVIIMSQLESLAGAHANIRIHDDCVIGPHAQLWCFHRLEIGACTLLGAEVSLVNGGHDLATFEPTAGPLRIGRGCWIGHSARIVRPVTIGDHVIVEPGAVVTDDIPANSIVAGVPAKVVGRNEPGERVWLWGNRYFNPQTFQCVTSHP